LGVLTIRRRSLLLIPALLTAPSIVRAASRLSRIGGGGVGDQLTNDAGSALLTDDSGSFVLTAS
jgi:hypothetical protein